MTRLHQALKVRCEGPSGKVVPGPVQAGVDALVDSIVHPKPGVATLQGLSFAAGMVGYVVCQHQMSRMLKEVEGFDKCKRDLGW